MVTWNPRHQKFAKVISRPMVWKLIAFALVCHLSHTRDCTQSCFCLRIARRVWWYVNSSGFWFSTRFLDIDNTLRFESNQGYWLEGWVRFVGSYKMACLYGPDMAWRLITFHTIKLTVQRTLGNLCSFILTIWNYMIKVNTSNYNRTICIKKAKMRRYTNL